MSIIRESQQVHVDSHDKISGTDGQFQIAVKGVAGKSFDYVCLQNAIFQKTYYLIQAGYNTFILRENGVSTTVTITPGNYSYKSFSKIIGTLLTASSSQVWTYSVTIPLVNQVTTGKYVFSVTGNAGLQPSFIFDQKNNIHEQFGFYKGSTNTFVASTITSTNVVNFQIEPALYIHCPQMVNNGSDDVLAVVFSSAPDFSSIVYECPDLESRSKKLIAMSNIYSISITDEDGMPIDFNGSNVILELLFYKKDNINDLWRTFLEIQYRKPIATTTENKSNQ